MLEFNVVWINMEFLNMKILFLVLKGEENEYNNYIEICLCLIKIIEWIWNLYDKLS